MAEENIRIYKGEKKEDPVLTEGERAAREFMAQQQNGNLKKAHALGETMAEAFLAAGVTGEFAAQKWVLLSFLTEQVIEEEIHPAVLAQSVEARVRELLEERAPEIAEAIHDPRGITLYSLNENRPRSRKEGAVFAELCERPDDTALAQEGEALAEQFAGMLQDLIRRADFTE